MIAERLRILRREKNISKRELVSQLPLNYSTYANYESGFREPNSEVLQLLAYHFGVSIDYLMGASNNRKKADEIAILTEDEHDHITKYRKLDSHGREIVDIVLQKEVERTAFLEVMLEKERLGQGNEHENDDSRSWVTLQVFQQRASAGLGNYLSSNSDDDYETMRFMATPISRRADFCVKIKGESMEPKICDGDIVFVKAVPKVDIDNVGIFVYEGEVFCKRLRLDHKMGTLFLESLNKSYALKKITNPDALRAVGLVIGIAEKV